MIHDRQEKRGWRDGPWTRGRDSLLREEEVVGKPQLFLEVWGALEGRIYLEEADEGWGWVMSFKIRFSFVPFALLHANCEGNGLLHYLLTS